MTRSLQRVQRGAVLFIALIVLVAMSLAGVALMRQVDTGTIIAGNLAFRQNAMHVADLGVEAARSWLMGQAAANLNFDVTANAYYATWQDVDFLRNDPAKTDYVWDGAATVTAGPYAPPAGYSVRYVIHRLCGASGPVTNTGCVKQAGAGGSSASGTKGAAAYGTYAISAPLSAMYRITVEVRGPRNTLSYVQATVF